MPPARRSRAPCPRPRPSILRSPAWLKHRAIPPIESRALFVTPAAMARGGVGGCGFWGGGFHAGGAHFAGGGFHGGGFHGGGFHHGGFGRGLAAGVIAGSIIGAGAYGWPGYYYDNDPGYYDDSY